MDLRPKLARSFAEAIFGSPIPLGMTQEELVGWATALILERFRSFDVPFPEGSDWCGTVDEGAIRLYLAKYPRVQVALDQVKARVEEKIPGCKFTLELQSDPESCHVCNEGQKIMLEIQPPTDDILEPLGELIIDFYEEPLIEGPLREGLFFIMHTF